MIKTYNSNIRIAITGKFRLGDIRHNYADLSKIKTLLGFKPEIYFEEGICKFPLWVLQQEIKLAALLEKIKQRRLLK
ncbi:hypothetical protein [Flavobacterium notoginsengisoli]|uniref:hypothetical protein n=1 Tax=Flavobacterium notoginsengisoli TaxID=1478199 RepID=UPI003630978C